jgi:hypothetical protein
LGSDPLGAKTRQGDHKTPEGIYVLDSRNAHSQFYKSIPISYPSARDRSEALKKGVSTGGFVFVHGLPKRLRMGGRIAPPQPVMHVDDAAERAQRQVGRPSTVENLRKPILEILQHTPDLASLEILRRIREAGYEGGKTALYALVASLRPKSVKPLVRFEGLPGEFSQHDFGQIEVQFVDGSSQRIHFFASRLKYSRFICVSLVPDEAVESLVRTLAEHLASWGGGGAVLAVSSSAKRKRGEPGRFRQVFLLQGAPVSR